MYIIPGTRLRSHQRIIAFIYNSDTGIKEVMVIAGKVKEQSKQGNQEKGPFYRSAKIPIKLTIGGCY